MITPKKKAELLYTSYTRICKIDDFGAFYTSDKAMAKKCALIAVDEIITLYKDLNSINGLILSPAILYWAEVKQEIENYESN